MRFGSSEADVIRVGDAAGKCKQLAVAQGVRPLLWQVLPPARPLEPTLVAQRLDAEVGSLWAAAK